MKRKYGKTLVSLLVVICTIASLLAGCSAERSESNSVLVEKETETRTITDLAGRTVEIPTSPQRIATIDGPSFEKIVMLGGGDRITLTRKLDFSKQYMLTDVYPNAENVPVVEDHFNPNIEELLSQNIDLVFFRDSCPDALEQMERAGIPVVITQISTVPTTNDEFFELQKNEMRTIAEVLGGEAIEKAEKWCDFFDEQISSITAVTNDIPDSKRPTVYYVKGPSALTAFPYGSYIDFWVDMAGGKYVSIDTGSDVTMEQIVSWNPDYIFLGRVGDKTLVTNDAAWKDISAVENGNVYEWPKDVQWDYSSQGILQLNIMAKILQPELFDNLDVPAMIKDYYKSFYDYDLSDDAVASVYQEIK